MSGSLQLTVDVFGLDGALQLLKTGIQQRLGAAVAYVADKTREQWQIDVQKARLWAVERDAYANSISWAMTSPTYAEVTASYRYAYEIEEGRPQRDLKRMLDTSLKVRVSKKGRRYLIIPFRHNTPGYTGHSSDMPDHVYAAARKLSFSQVTGQTTRVSGTGAWDIKTRAPLTVPQKTYAWGTRLAPGSMGPNQRGRVDRFAGMVRFKDTAFAGKPRSVFMTFRVMAEGQSGWLVAPRPGLHLAKAVTQKMMPMAKAEFAGAITGATL